jgi:hypothetical protein
VISFVPARVTIHPAEEAAFGGQEALAAAKRAAAAELIILHPSAGAWPAVRQFVGSSLLIVRVGACAFRALRQRVGFDGNVRCGEGRVVGPTANDEFPSRDRSLIVAEHHCRRKDHGYEHRHWQGSREQGDVA